MPLTTQRGATSGPQVTRKLTIRTKLAAALAVPLVALAAFAAFQVNKRAIAPPTR